MSVIAAIKYDVSDVEAGGGGVQPDPGTMPGKIVSMVNRKKKSDGTTTSDLEIVVDVGEDYARMWTYVTLPDAPQWDKKSHGWKLRELTDALGLDPKGTIDPAKIAKQQPPVLVKVIADTDQGGEYKAKIKNLFLLTDEALAQYGGKASNGNGNGDGDAAEANEEGPYDRSEIETWGDDDLKGYAEEIGADGPVSGRGWKAKLIDAIIATQDEAGSETPEEDAEVDGEAAEAGSPALEGVEQDVLDELKPDAAHYADWGDDDLKWMVEGLRIEGNVATSGRGWKPKAIAAIVELAEGSGGEAAEETTVVDDYDDENEAGDGPLWSLPDLKAEIAERNEQGAEIEVPKGRVTREKLIELLRADNAAAEPF